MTSKFMEEEKKDFSEETKPNLSAKKPLKSILSSYLKEKTFEGGTKSIKEELLSIKSESKKTKTSVEMLFDLQARLSKAYEETKNEKIN